ncbi:hypothetical protein CDD83_10494 [Cordyceps sp. RAO-2017]|nr:hypothetical protein CDD83_10494 [Cordyceps sp. RAO-2017]
MGNERYVVPRTGPTAWPRGEVSGRCLLDAATGSEPDSEPVGRAAVAEPAAQVPVTGPLPARRPAGGGHGAVPRGDSHRGLDPASQARRQPRSTAGQGTSARYLSLKFAACWSSRSQHAGGRPGFALEADDLAAKSPAEQDTAIDRSMAANRGRRRRPARTVCQRAQGSSPLDGAQRLDRRGRAERARQFHAPAPV